jgi:threonine aldolase
MGLQKIGVTIDIERVQTNIVLIDVKQLGTNSTEFVSQIAKDGVKASNFGPTIVRMVTHRGIEREDIEYAL